MDIDGAGRAELTDYHRDCHGRDQLPHLGEDPARPRRTTREDAMTARSSYEETFDYVRDVVEQALADADGPWTAEQRALAAEAAADVLADGVDLGRPIQTVDTGERL
jgi:hypothetical protein